MYRGIGYPVKRSDAGGFEIKDSVDLIEDNIIQILGTRKRERVMLPEFGSKVRELLFEPLDQATLALMRTYIIDDIKRWEDRVIIRDNILEPNYEEQFVVVRFMLYFKPTAEVRQFSVKVDRKGVQRWQGN